MTLAETTPLTTAPPEPPKPPTTWQTADGSEVAFNDAMALWTSVAYDVLRETAGRYNAYVTYSDLAKTVQAQSGMQTRLLTRNWIGKVLSAIAERCASANERQLTSLCVKTADETVGEGYTKVFELSGEPVPEDLQLHAAEARFECYQFYGATIPRGGKATLTPKVARVREQAAAKRRDETPPVLCPKCFVQVPLTGNCDGCDG